MATVCCARPLYDYDSDEAVRARSLSRLVLPRGRENLNILLSLERERESSKTFFGRIKLLYETRVMYPTSRDNNDIILLATNITRIQFSPSF